MSPFPKWLIEHHPRVTFLDQAQQCTEMKGGAPVKAYWGGDGYRQTDPEVLEKWRCKVPAHWKFTALKQAKFSKNGVMCYRHLYYRVVFGDQDEMTATEELMVSTGYAKPEETLTQRGH